MASKSNYDVIVVGGGIPGLVAARDLESTGRKVCVFEASTNPELPDYSTAGIPVETLSDYNLPWDSIHSPIRHQIIGTSEIEFKKTAKDRTTFAYVLDFGKAKRLLGENLNVRYGERITSIRHLAKKDRYILQSGSRDEVSAPVVIDATGSSRVLLNQFNPVRRARPSIGLEYRIQSNHSSLDRFRETIATYFDDQLTPHGYGWVFADGKDVFKIGLFEFWCHPNRNLPPLEKRLQKFVKWLGVDLKNSKFKLLGKFGGSKVIGRPYGKPRVHRLLGVGDSIGAINPFLAEGIRQGLDSVRFAVNSIDRDRYGEFDREWRKYQGARFQASELLAKFLYLKPDATVLRAVVESCRNLNSEQLREIAFHYRFENIFMKSPIKNSLVLSKRFPAFTRQLLRLI